MSREAGIWEAERLGPIRDVPELNTWERDRREAAVDRLREWASDPSWCPPAAMIDRYLERHQ